MADCRGPRHARHFELPPTSPLKIITTVARDSFILPSLAASRAIPKADSLSLR